jgi:hypothetical protein
MFGRKVELQRGEPFFLENAGRWAEALRDAGVDVVMTERVG